LNAAPLCQLAAFLSGIVFIGEPTLGTSFVSFRRSGSSSKLRLNDVVELFLRMKDLA
jgi:hypothetical protein